MSYTMTGTVTQLIKVGDTRVLHSPRSHSSVSDTASELDDGWPTSPGPARSMSPSRRSHRPSRFWLVNCRDMYRYRPAEARRRI